MEKRKFAPLTRVKEEEEEVRRYMLVFISLIEGKTTSTTTKGGVKEPMHLST